MAGPALTREITDAGVGVGRLLRYDPRWADAFDPTTSGFLRSFLGPLLGLPFALIVAAMIATADEDGAASSSALIWAQGVSHVLDAIAYPVLIGAIARPLGIGAGYGVFIIVVNWASLFLNIALAGASAFTLFGEGGTALFSVLALVILCASVFITWRAARETLTAEIPPAILVVVLSIGMLALSGQVAYWLVEGFG